MLQRSWLRARPGRWHLWGQKTSKVASMLISCKWSRESTAGSFCLVLCCYRELETGDLHILLRDDRELSHLRKVLSLGNHQVWGIQGLVKLCFASKSYPAFHWNRQMSILFLWHQDYWQAPHRAGRWYYQGWSLATMGLAFYLMHLRFDILAGASS